VAGLSGNKTIEDAIKWSSAWTAPPGARHERRYESASADIESPTRADRGQIVRHTEWDYDLWLEVRQVEEAKTNPDFCVYVVENVRQGDPEQFKLRAREAQRPGDDTAGDRGACGIAVAFVVLTIFPVAAWLLSSRPRSPANV
jgi:hypothetical protein